MVLGELRGPVAGAHLRYRRFAEEGLLREIENPFKAVRWQAVLGGETFARKIQDRINELRASGREITAVRRSAISAGPLEVVGVVAKRYAVPARTLLERGGYGLEARNVAMWMVWHKCGLSLREIGELFGGIDYAAVAQRIRRIKARKPKEMQKLQVEMSNV